MSRLIFVICVLYYLFNKITERNYELPHKSTKFTIQPNWCPIQTGSFYLLIITSIKLNRRNVFLKCYTPALQLRSVCFYEVSHSNYNLYSLWKYTTNKVMVLHTKGLSERVFFFFAGKPSNYHTLCLQSGNSKY